MGLEFWKSHGEMSLNVECTTYNEEWPIAQFNKSAKVCTSNALLLCALNLAPKICICDAKLSVTFL